MLSGTSSRLNRIAGLTFVVALSLCFAAGAMGASKSGGNDWPGFRGVDGQGAVTNTTLFSARNEFSLKTKWKRPLGSGYSGIAVAGDHVITAFSAGESDVLAAFDAATGSEQWRFDIGPTYVGHDGSHTGPISTPLIVGERVVVLGAFGNLYAVNLRSGSKLWSTHLKDDHGAPKPHYGFSTSPILLDGVIVVQLGGDNGAVAGFDPATGKRLWAVGADTVLYQSPIIWSPNGRKQVIAAGGQKLFGIDARNGFILWEHEHGGKGSSMGIASVSPLPVADNRLFLSYMDETSTVLELSFQDGSATGKQLWDSKSIRKSYNCSVYHDGHIYGYSSRVMTCVDAKTGERVWRSREPGDGFTIVVDGHLIVQTKKGGLSVAPASPSGYDEVAALPLFDDLSWTPPSFANGSIYARSMSELARVDITSGIPAGQRIVRKEEVPTKSRFGRFLSEVNRSSNKKAVVDQFMAGVDRMTFIEGRSMVHFIYRGKADDMAVAGDVIGARQERVMIRVAGTDLFYYSTPLEPDARVNYVFIKNYEQILDPLNTRKTTTKVYKQEMEMSFGGDPMEMSWVAMPDWKPPTYLKKAGVSRRGRLEKKELESKILEGTVNLQIYLPRGYDKGKKRYPVAYVHGGADAVERGKLPTMLDNLIGKRVTPLVAVFIDFQSRGRRTKYAQMVAEELVPFIDGNFRTQASPDARANIGMGFPGFAAFVCAFSHPDVMGKVGCQSTFMFDSMKKELDPLVTTASEKPLSIYLDWGKYDLRNSREAWDMAETNREFAETLRGKGYTFTGGEANDGTGWSSWQNRTGDLLEALFPAS